MRARTAVSVAALSVRTCAPSCAAMVRASASAPGSGCSLARLVKRPLYTYGMLGLPTTNADVATVVACTAAVVDVAAVARVARHALREAVVRSAGVTATTDRDSDATAKLTGLLPHDTARR